LFSKPLITIGHFSAFEPFVSFFEYFPLPKNVFFTFPSKRECGLAHYIPQSQKFFVPHGINISTIPFENTKREHLLWFGRLDPTMPKGGPEAIALSNTLKIPIDIFTYIEDTKYYEGVIKPLLTNFTNFKTGVARSEYFKKAKVYVVPVGWEEPFGLTLLEAMASGTPVVAYAKGAFPEIIKDGVTGFLVNPSDTDIRGDFIIKKTGLDGLAEAVTKIFNLSDAEYEKLQKMCREHIEKNYTISKMVDAYETLFKSVTRLQE
jgi:glycosyltransferase involved in cell wall biosynthesis